MKYCLSSNPKHSFIPNYNLLLFDCDKEEDNTGAAAAQETRVDAEVAAGSLELDGIFTPLKRFSQQATSFLSLPPENLALGTLMLQ